MSALTSRLFGSALLGLALSACSKRVDLPATKPSSAHVERVALQIAPQTEYRPPRGRVLALPANADAWKFTGGNAELVTGADSPDGEPKLRVTAAHSAKLVIPGPLELGKFETLAVRVFGAKEALSEVRVIPRRRQREWPVSAAQPVAEGEGWRLFRVALAPEVIAAEHVDEIALELEGELAASVMLDPPVLEWSPPMEWRKLMPADANQQVGLQLGHEWRQARGLRPGLVARGALSASDVARRLVFGYGSLGASRGNPGQASVRVTLRDGAGAAHESSFPLAGPDQWYAADVDVPASATPLAVEIELVLERQGWLAVAVDEPQAFAPDANAPTVLLVTSDTHRGDHLGLAHEGVALETPALDALAARGVFFSNCFSTTNVTLPSHVALLTGTHPRDTGVTDNNTELADSAPTLAEAFRAAGYHTLALTSLNLLSAGFAGVGQGFDRMSWPQKRRSAQETVELATQWIAQADGRPLFVWVHVFDAHTPYDPPPDLARKYYDANKDPFDTKLEPEEEWRAPTWLEGVHDPDYVRALYKSEITGLDRSLASLFDDARIKRGVVAVTGDHGEVLGSHGIWWEHKGVYPDTLHVPLILCAPGLASGQRVDDPVINADIGRTLLDLVGLKTSAFAGRDLLEAVARGDLKEWPRFGLAGHRQSASIDYDGWHLILHLEELAEGRRTGRAKHQVELFELARDPKCEHDLVRERIDKARELRQALVRWLSDWKGGQWRGTVHTDAATVKELAGLGYTSADGSLPAERLIDPQCSCEWCVLLR